MSEIRSQSNSVKCRFGPRFSRNGLRGRFSHLASHLRKCEALASNLAEGKLKAFRIGNFAFFGSAIVVAEHLFIDVPLKVERLNRNVGSAQSALEQRPEVFDALSVNLSANVFDGMVHNFVCESF